MAIEWTYHVMSGFIVRENEKKLEVKDVKTDHWEDQTKDLELWRMLKDGHTVTESEANDTYEYFKQKHRS